MTMKNYLGYYQAERRGSHHSEASNSMSNSQRSQGTEDERRSSRRFLMDMNNASEVALVNSVKKSKSNKSQKVSFNP